MTIAAKAPIAKREAIIIAIHQSTFIHSGRAGALALLYTGFLYGLALLRAIENVLIDKAVFSALKHKHMNSLIKQKLFKRIIWEAVEQNGYKKMERRNFDAHDALIRVQV